VGDQVIFGSTQRWRARLGSNWARPALNVSRVAREKRGWFGFVFPSVGAGGSAIQSVAAKIGPITFPYRRKSLLSPTELVFYNVLKEAIGDRFLILLKVGVRDLCEITNGELNHSAFNRVAAEQMDFVLCDLASLIPVVAIDLDDSTLYPRDRAERDSFMNDLFRVIGVSLIRQRVQARYDPAAIARWVDAAASRPGGAAPVSPRPLRPAS
jgi:uncharacterized protein DUF2726